MATKSITVTNEAYERLASYKEENESFSDVINKLAKKNSLLDLVGILSKKEANEVEKHVKDLRKRLRKRLDKVASRIK